MLAKLKVDPPARLASIDEAALRQLRAMDFSFLSGLGPETVREVATGLIRNTLLGNSRADSIEAVSGTLGKFSANAAAVFDTAIFSFDRFSTSAIWCSAGIDRFKYVGPRDLKNREFCEARVNKVFSITEIEAMDNGTKLMPVLVYGGGWSCRHVWHPAPA